VNDFVVAYRRYAEFEGRSDRKEFWYYVLFYVIVSAILSVLDQTFFGGSMFYRDGLIGNGYGNWSVDTDGPLVSIFSLASLIPTISVSVRRLHDINKSGWFFLFWFIPIVGWIFLLIWYCLKGEPVSNRFGEPPVGSQQAEI
jgi:uncharacterized membrane protein YhaH (DUF805 family)